ncbi:MAG TPA: hypothetical protein VFQ22_08175 [Longimicrobiales bacterium]|nr:hypothetical protein [Longimicrobiales bacterium]
MPFVRVPPLGSLDAPEWRVERVWFTADLPGSEGELFRIVDAIFPGDSALVLADGGASALLFVDAGSATVRRVGREGDGPGEFRYLQHVLPHPSGNVLTYDGRLTRFDLAGEVVGTERLDPESVVSLRPLLQREDGTVAAVLGEQRIFGPGGEHRDTVPLMVFSTGASAPDTIATWLGLERAFASAPEGIYLVPIAFARTFFAAANLRRIAITSSDSLDVTIFSAQMAPLLRIVAPPEARGPSPAEVDEWRARMMAGVPDRSATLLRALESTPVRTRYPGLDGLVLDALDRLWVAEHPGMGVDRAG